MDTNFRMKLTGAFGNPIDENPSPVMFEAGFASRDLKWRYQLMKVKQEDLEYAIRGIRAMNFEGVNLTIPHKVEAVKYMDELSESASIIGAINTIINRDGKLIGDNTDGKGFVLGMKKNGIELQGRKIVILGAGGAARAISVECALADCQAITIINVTEERGLELKNLLNSKTGCKAEYIKWIPGVHIPSCDILINATSIGLYPDKNKPDICYEDIHPGMIVQDIIPNPAQTPFYLKAKELGATVYDGQRMLVYQGLFAIELWTGITPDDKAMIKALKDALE